MKICAWCGKRVRLWQRYCSVCKPLVIGEAGIYLLNGGPPCPYMANLESPAPFRVPFPNVDDLAATRFNLREWKDRARDMERERDAAIEERDALRAERDTLQECVVQHHNVGRIDEMRGMGICTICLEVREARNALSQDTESPRSVPLAFNGPRRFEDGPIPPESPDEFCPACGRPWVSVLDRLEYAPMAGKPVLVCVGPHRDTESPEEPA